VLLAIKGSKVVRDEEGYGTCKKCPLGLADLEPKTFYKEGQTMP
jgi:hypothetical protein